MLKRSTFALLLCLPLCAFGAGGSLFHSSSASESSAEVTTWRGERALRIPVELSATDWSKAGFAASSTKPVQTAWLYLTETMFQLQDGSGHALMGGPRSDLELEVSQCIRMRSLTISVCANTPFPASKEAREMLHGSSRDFSWLYYHLAEAGHRAAPAPPGMMLAGARGALPGGNSSSVAAPVLECRLMNPDGTPAAEQPFAAKAGPLAPHPAASAPMIMAAEPNPAPMPAPPMAVAEPSHARVATPVNIHAAAPVNIHAAAPAVVETASEPAPHVDHAQNIRAMAAASHPALMDAAASQPAAMLEAHNAPTYAAPPSDLPIHVHQVAAPAAVERRFVVAGVGHATNRANISFAMMNTMAPPAPMRHAPANVPAQPRAVVATSTPRHAEAHTHAAAAQPDMAAIPGDMASDDLTPAGAPRGVVPEARNRIKAAAVAASKPVDARSALLQEEKAARAARLDEVQMKRSQEMNAIPGSAEVRSVPAEKPRSPYAARVTTSTVFSQPTHVDASAPAVRNPAAASASSESFAEIAAPAAPSAQGQNAAPAANEMAEATENPPVRKSRIVRPAFKSAALPTVIDNEQ